MKTLLLISNSVPHYRVSVYNYFFRRFSEHGWRFAVASDAAQLDSKSLMNFPFYQLNFQFSKYVSLIKDLQPDVVMFHLHLKDPLFWQLIHWLKFKRTPIICWTKGANLEKPQSSLRYHLFNYFHGLSNALILYSDKQTNLVKQRYRHKIFAANNTVNFEDYPAVPDSKEAIKKEFGIPFEKVVLFAGTMGVDGDRKKAGHIIDVFRGLKRSGIGLVLVGGGMGVLQQERLNPQNTLYLGTLHDKGNIRISKIFKAADLFVIPGHVGLGINQAFYWGLPVVTEEGLHPPEIQYLKPGRNGYIVPENDLLQLQERMLFLLDNDSIRMQFSHAAREDIIREASIEGMFLSFLRAVDCVSSSKSPQEA